MCVGAILVLGLLYIDVFHHIFRNGFWVVASGQRVARVLLIGGLAGVGGLVVLIIRCVQGPVPGLKGAQLLRGLEGPIFYLEIVLVLEWHFLALGVDPKGILILLFFLDLVGLILKFCLVDI